MNLENIKNKISKVHNRDILQYYFGFSYHMEFEKNELEEEIKNKNLNCSPTYYVKELSVIFYKEEAINAMYNKLTEQDIYIIIKIFGTIEDFKRFIGEHIKVDYRIDFTSNYFSKCYYTRYTVNTYIDIPNTIDMTVEEFIHQEKMKGAIADF